MQLYLLPRCLGGEKLMLATWTLVSAVDGCVSKIMLLSLMSILDTLFVVVFRLAFSGGSCRGRSSSSRRWSTAEQSRAANAAITWKALQSKKTYRRSVTLACCRRVLR